MGIDRHTIRNKDLSLYFYECFQFELLDKNLYFHTFQTQEMDFRRNQYITSIGLFYKTIGIYQGVPVVDGVCETCEIVKR